MSIHTTRHCFGAWDRDSNSNQIQRSWNTRTNFTFEPSPSFNLWLNCIRANCATIVSPRKGRAQLVFNQVENFIRAHDFFAYFRDVGALKVRRGYCAKVVVCPDNLTFETRRRSSRDEFVMRAKHVELSDV